MKIRSLLLGTVAAAGLSTGAFATDLGVETGLDVCDDLGITGLTISSDTNCLQISGSVKYEFSWGDYNSTDTLFYRFSAVNSDQQTYTIMDPTGGNIDHDSSLESWLKFVATADSSFGPASATIKFDIDALLNNNNAPYISQLFVSIGEGTVFTAGLADSIFKKGDDEPLNFLGLFNSDAVDKGVIDTDDSWSMNGETGGQVLQVVTSMDNLWFGAALEDIANQGTAVGVIAYSTDEIKAHASLAVDEVYNGFDNWVFHSGFQGTFDTIKLVAAYGANDTAGGEQNALVSASIDLDNFVLAASGEWVARNGGNNEYGFGASIATEVSDGITVKAGYRHYLDNTPANDTLDQFAGQVVAAVSDEVTLTGEAGAIIEDGSYTVYYGSAKAEWNPGGDFKASVKAEANSAGAYKVTTTAEKAF